MVCSFYRANVSHFWGLVQLLHIFGNTPVVNDLFTRVDEDMEIFSWISFKIYAGMLLGPKLLLFFKVFIRWDISLGFCRSWPIEIKKLLKCSEMSWGSVIVFPSISNEEGVLILLPFLEYMILWIPCYIALEFLLFSLKNFW